MTKLTEYERGLLYGTLSIEQWKNLPVSLQRKLINVKAKEHED